MRTIANFLKTRVKMFGQVTSWADFKYSFWKCFGENPFSKQERLSYQKHLTLEPRRSRSGTVGFVVSGRDISITLEENFCVPVLPARIVKFRSAFRSREFGKGEPV